MTLASSSTCIWPKFHFAREWTEKVEIHVAEILSFHDGHWSGPHRGFLPNINNASSSVPVADGSNQILLQPPASGTWACNLAVQCPRVVLDPPERSVCYLYCLINFCLLVKLVRNLLTTKSPFWSWIRPPFPSTLFLPNSLDLLGRYSFPEWVSASRLFPM